MNSLPVQKLSITEFLVAVAVGLMLFLLPNDAKNQFESELVCEGYVFVVSFVIIVIMHFIVKRYEAIGASLFFMAVFNLISLVFGIINGFATKGNDYWPRLSEYNIICYFILWVTPFFMVVILRMLTRTSRDTNEKRRSFTRFMVMSMRALMIIYGIVFLMRLMLPSKPDILSEREMEFIPFVRIIQCFNGSMNNGVIYFIWNCIILAPLSFYLSVMVSNFKPIHALIIALPLGLAVEAFQFLLNTAFVSIDDALMYCVGALFGVGIKLMFDSIRGMLTSGRDPSFLSYEYVPVPRKSTKAPQIVEE